MQGVWVLFLVSKLRSHMLHSQKTKTWNRSIVITNSIKTLKVVHIKKKKNLKNKNRIIILASFFSSVWAPWWSNTRGSLRAGERWQQCARLSLPGHKVGWRRGRGNEGEKKKSIFIPGQGWAVLALKSHLAETCTVSRNHPCSPNFSTPFCQVRSCG